MSTETTNDRHEVPAALAEPTVHVRAAWIAGLSLASLGMWIATLTPVQVLLPLQLQSIAPEHKIVALGLVSAAGALSASTGKYFLIAKRTSESTMTRVLLAPLLLCLTVWVSSGQTASTVETVALRRGVNMGNMLEAPEEGRWGLVVKEKYFDLIKEAGFDFVRLPVAWGSHANEDPPYLIDPNLFKRIDDVVGWALQRNLPIIIDLHSYNQEIAQEGNKYNTAQKKDPVAFYNAMARFLSIWRQVSEHYKDCPPDVLFELLNEPKDPLQASLWNQYLAQAVKMIRENNPTRDVIIGPVELYSFNWVYELELPPDPHLIVTFHYYLPVDFTSQGLEELFPGSTVWLGTTWPATEDQKAEIIHNFDYVAQWSKRHGNIRILLGELGTIYRAPEDSRIRWTTFVRKQAEARGFSWSYWDFAAQFGVYDPDAETWRRDLLKALIP